MFIAYIVVTLVTLVANAFEGVATIIKADFVKQNIAEVRVPVSWLPMLGAAKAAGALGLLAGLLGLRPLGIAAAAGLTLFFVCAVIVHLWTRVVHNIAFPVLFLAFAIASLGLAIAV
ncbi:DoxX family protein [Nocardia sp. NBC_01388]|uniref:DoxX family protein n=1 Tax=Nocardia sp. NBC_01388 TaxID=2903596 RepID=UPI00324DA896